MKKYTKLLTVLFLITLLSLNLTACKERSLEQVEASSFVLGTHGQIRIYAPSPKKGNKAIEAAFERIREIENKMSPTIVGSEVHSINQNAGKQPVKVSDDTLFVINKGIEYNRITDGTFNISLGSLIELWSIGKEGQKVPTFDEIEEARQHIDINQLQIDGNNVLIKDPKMLMDLGGIAKGYSVDEAVEVLKKHGIQSGFVNLGGDIYAFGEKPDKKPWGIGVKKPVIDSGTVMAKILLQDQSIVSSGDYERYFVENDIRYHHILDPATGFPSESGVISVTIISDLAIDGDALSTAVFVLGLENGIKLIENIEGVEAVIITKDNTVYTTSGATDKIEILDKSYKLAN